MSAQESRRAAVYDAAKAGRPVVFTPQELIGLLRDLSLLRSLLERHGASQHDITQHEKADGS